MTALVQGYDAVVRPEGLGEPLEARALHPVSVEGDDRLTMAGVVEEGETKRAAMKESPL